MYTEMYNLLIVFCDKEDKITKCYMTKAKLCECLDIISDITKNYIVRRVNMDIIIDNRKDK